RVNATRLPSGATLRPLKSYSLFGRMVVESARRVPEPSAGMAQIAGLGPPDRKTISLPSGGSQVGKNIGPVPSTRRGEPPDASTTESRLSDNEPTRALSGH